MLWHDFNKVGYVVERTEIEKQPSRQSVKQKLNTAPIKPWTLEEWKAKANRNDTTAAIAAQLLYGKTKLPVVKQGRRGKSSEVNLSEALDQKYDLENRFSLALLIADNNSFIANGLGLRFVDKTVEKGKVYLYSIHAANAAAVASDSSAVTIITSQVETLPSMPEIRYMEGDHTVTFKWDRAFAGNYFSAYHYERSSDGGKTYHRLNKRPYFQPTSAAGEENDLIILTDSLPQNYKTYHYRIIGITPFGELGLPSPAMAVMGIDQTPPEAPQKVTAQHLGKKIVKLSWEKPVKELDFAGFMVGRSESSGGPFSPVTLRLLPKDATTFTDTTAVPWGTNYYIVSAVDTAQNTGLSIPAYVVMTDTLAPAKPIGLSGKIDTTGVVTISWKLGKEMDLMGYLVYFANAKDHTFNPITKDFLADSTFTTQIPLTTLTEKIYYRVVAFDKNRNPSAYSDILELKKPDKIAPVAPAFTGFVVSDTTVHLEWASSSSSDVASQIIYRKEIGTNDWVELAKLDTTIESFTDTKVQKLARYEYSIVAVDDDGNRSSMSFPQNVRVYDSGMRKKIESFSVNPDGKGSISLAWKYSMKGDYHFLVYRSFNGSGLHMYEQIPGDKSSMADANVSKGIYEYAIKAVFKDGGQSPLMKSKTIEVK
jgi:fibronectin type 3 domain-containing protein